MLDLVTSFAEPEPESLGVGENTREREREKRLSTIDDRVGDERGG